MQRSCDTETRKLNQLLFHTGSSSVLRTSNCIQINCGWERIDDTHLSKMILKFSTDDNRVFVT